MISQNDLFDLTSVLINIRDNIKCDTNHLVLVKIQQVLKYSENHFEDNQFRKAISTIEELDRNRWFFIYHDNVYARHQFLNCKPVYSLLLKFCELLDLMISEGDFDKAVDLVDCFHCLPEIIVNNSYTIPKSYWKSFVKPYRIKWDKNFLIEEEKSLKRLKS